MKFDVVELLYLIWLIPFLMGLYYYGMRRRQSILAAYITERSLNAVRTGQTNRLRRVRAGLTLMALICIITALAGPQYGFSWKKMEQKGVDILIAIDCSRSMLAGDIKPTRLDRAKREIIDLLSMLKGDRVGLIVFSGVAFLQCPLTLDYEAFYMFLNSLSPALVPVGGTRISDAIDTAINAFDPDTATEKAVILITDGESTGGDPVASARAAAEKGIRIFTIGVGRDDGIPVPDSEGGFKKDREGNIVLTRLDEAMLKKVAAISGGTYVRSVAGDMDLDLIYTRDILLTMDRSTLSDGKRQVWENRYQWCLAMALVLLLAEWMTPSVRRQVYRGVIVAVLLSGMVTVPRLAAASDPMTQGYAAYQAGEYEQALKCYIDAQLADPENPLIDYNMGTVYYRLGQFDQAAAHFKKALEQEDALQKGTAYYNLGNSAFRQKAYDDAISSYEKALELMPDDAMTKDNLALARQAKEMAAQTPPSTDSADSNQKGEEKEKDTKTGDDSTDDTGKEKQPSGAKDTASQPNPPDTDDQSQAPPAEPDASDADTNQGKQPQDPLSEASSEPQPAAADEKPADRDPDTEKVLNRLQDQPGQAMIPVYRPSQVEKDW